MLRRIFYILILLLILGCSGTKHNPIKPIKTWPLEIQEITYLSSADNTYQPALFFTPKTENPKPLLVALHSWSSDYLQKSNYQYADWCIKNDWVFIHPNFRGPNNNPNATGSELVIQDILSAVEYAKQTANIDENKIYLVGASGGGYTALLMAGKHPEIWAGVSAWCPIYDLKNWYHECLNTYPQYSNDIINSCGGVPEPGTSAELEYIARSPSSYLHNANNIKIDISTGINDGHNGSVPVSHALLAYNSLITEKIPIETINYITNNAAIPDELKQNYTDPDYPRQILFRRQSQNARITLFDGGHEILFESALKWLAEQQKD
jgi:predicted peptidase